MSIETPIDVSPWFDQAHRMICALIKRIPIRAAILDDWNTGADIKGPRIIYDTPFAEQCRRETNCSSCPIYNVLQEDAQVPGILLRMTLCRATESHHAILPTQQPMLNCKTVAQYRDAFVAYIVAACTSREVLEAELDWVRGFRLVYDEATADDPRATLERERSVKVEIIRAVLAAFSTSHDYGRSQIVRVHLQTWLRDALKEHDDA